MLTSCMQLAGQLYIVISDLSALIINEALEFFLANLFLVKVDFHLKNHSVRISCQKRINGPLL